MSSDSRTMKQQVPLPRFWLLGIWVARAVRRVHAAFAEHPSEGRHGSEDGVLDSQRRPSHPGGMSLRGHDKPPQFEADRDPLLVGLAVAGQSEKGLEERLGIQRWAQRDANLRLARALVGLG
jgi:hypothetical protein